jgi:hypothetical protein
VATRIQGLVLGLGKAKQANISTASASFLRFKQINTDVSSNGFSTESDKDEIGKGNEFTSAAGVYPVAFSPGRRIEKFATAEFVTWAVAYGLGNVAEASSIYTILPIDPATTLELPYFTLVEQLAEGGGSAIDNAFVGCAIDDWQLDFNIGPGRQSAKFSCSWMGSGLLTSPSGVSVPALTTEHHMLGASMALTINGRNYVSDKTILKGSLGWKNNLMGDAGFFPGSGVQSGAAVRGRLEIGNRVPSFRFSARQLATSDEYTKLFAQTTGTAVLTLTFDSTHTVTFTLQSVSYRSVENTDQDGIASVTVEAEPKFDATNGVLTCTAKCGITGIGQ